MLSNFSKFSLFFILCLASLTSKDSYGKKGDWTSSGSPLAPSMPAEPGKPVLKCSDSMGRSYVFDVSSDAAGLRAFKKGEAESLSGSLSLTDNATSNFYSMTFSKESRDRNLYRIDLADFEKDRLRKEKFVPTAMYFRSGFGTQKIKMVVKNQRSYEYVDLKCRATWFFIF